MIYTVTLNPAVDYLVRLDRPLRPGELNRCAEAELEFGGKGVNVSRVLRALEVDSTATGFAAGFTGAALEEYLRAQGIAADFVRLSAGFTRINVKILGEGGETQLNAQGPRLAHGDWDALWDKLCILDPEDDLVLAGGLPAGTVEADFAEFLRRAQGTGAHIVADLAGRAMEMVLGCKPFLIKPNRAELAELMGFSPREEELEECALALQRRGARNVLLSLGGEGALLLDEQGGVHRAQAPRGVAVNTVGAGDSMVAGFLTEFLKTGRYEDALRLGIAAGSATAFHVGLASCAEIKALLKS